MKEFPELKSYSEQRWIKRILQIELGELRKEHEHLSRKRQERTLTDWEAQRVKELGSELMRIMQHLKQRISTKILMT